MGGGYKKFLDKHVIDKPSTLAAMKKSCQRNRDYRILKTEKSSTNTALYSQLTGLQFPTAKGDKAACSLTFERAFQCRRVPRDMPATGQCINAATVSEIKTLFPNFVCRNCRNTTMIPPGKTAVAFRVKIMKGTGHLETNTDVQWRDKATNRWVNATGGFGRCNVGFG